MGKQTKQNKQKTMKQLKEDDCSQSIKKYEARLTELYTVSTHPS